MSCRHDLQPSSDATQANQSRIGAAEDAGNYWIGVVDDVRFYPRALSATEVGKLVAQTRG